MNPLQRARNRRQVELGTGHGGFAPKRVRLYAHEPAHFASIQAKAIDWHVRPGSVFVPKLMSKAPPLHLISEFAGKENLHFMFSFCSHCNHLLDCIPNLLNRLNQMAVIQVSIPGRSLHIGMTEQTPDHRQGFLVHRSVTGKGVA